MKFNSLIPELTVLNLTKSLHFYVDTLGFKIEYAREESNFAFISLQGSQLMLDQINGNWETGPLEYPFGRGINFQIMVDKIDPMIDALEKAGHRLMQKPAESWYRKNNREVGQRQFLVQDLDGYLLRFAESLGERKIT